MKMKFWQHLGVAFILALPTVGAMSCSDDQSQLEDAVQGQEEGQEEGQGQQGAQEGEQGYENGGANAYDEGGYGKAQGNYAAEAAPAAGEQAELQGIVDGMNSQQPVEGEQYVAAPPVLDAPMVEAPMPPAPAVEQQAAVGMAAAPGLPELGSKMSYIIKRGDTLASVATKIYGNMEKWREIAEFTGMANPNMIYPGDVVYYQLTDQTMAFASAYETVKRSEVVVKPGDTLSTISSRVLGRSSDWKMIWRQNDTIDNPDRLNVGQTLYYVDPGSLMAALDSGVQSQDLVIAEQAISSQLDRLVDDSSEQFVALGDVEMNDSELVNNITSEFDADFASLNTVGFNRVI